MPSRSAGRLGVPVLLAALLAAPMPRAAATPGDAGPVVPAAPRAPIASPFVRDPAAEARIRAIVEHMTLAQKIGQMTQPDIRAITPAEVRQYAIGSVLNGGGAWPRNDKHASLADWLALADAWWDASTGASLPVPVPAIWGTDAVHGHNNVYGMTLFPHNIGLGAARDPALVERIGEAVAAQVRATGIDWTFAPTVAVVRDDRWGRTYDGFSEDPTIVAALAAVVATSDGAVRAATAQVYVQQDARRIAFAGDGQFSADSSVGQDYGGYLGTRAALAFDVVVERTPAGPVHVRIDCGHPCGGAVDVTKALRALPLHAKATLRIPLQCFVDQGVDFSAVDTPFAIDTARPFVASFADIRWQVGGADAPDALPCTPPVRTVSPPS